MNISSEGILVILFVGLVAGWLAGKIVRGTGFGLIGDILVGIAGALLASFLFPKLGIHLGTGLVSEIIYSAIGAIILLLIVSPRGGMKSNSATSLLPKPGRARISGAIASVTPRPCSAASSMAGTLSSQRWPRGCKFGRPAALSQAGQARGCVVRWISTCPDRSLGSRSPPLASAGVQTGRPLTSISGSNFSPAECSRP
jgi:uncharacterized membrane protein YeaQ/YmgE (transglycosylase-associated protein family)